MGREQISTTDATYLMFSVISAKIFLSVPRYLVLDGETAGWLFVLMAGATGALGWTFVVLFMRRFPGRSILQAVEETLGPYLAIPANLLYTFIFLIITAVVIRQLGETVISAILPTTPISVIIGTLLAVAVYTCYLGKEAVARVARFFMPVIVALVLAILVLSLPSGARPSELLPLFGPGIGTLLMRSISRSSLFVEVLLLPLLVPHLKEPEKMARIGYQAILWSTLFWLAVTAVFLMLFPYPEAVKNPFPLLALARLINIGRFLQRVESVFIFAWIFAAAAKISATLLASTLSFAETFHLKAYRPMVFAFSVLAMSLSFLPPNIIEAMRWDREIIRVWGALPGFVLPLVLWGIAAARGKGGQQRAGEKD
ncbi:MAG: GerAB/ArcD/ProY family transporter [Bacillota bacterium]